MTKKFAPVQKNTREMTTGEIRSWLDGLPNSVVMRSILMAEIQAVQAGAPRERRTMRNMWYDVVKPVLSRAGILNITTSGGKPVPWDRLLSKYLAELVREGVTSYEELLIVDGSRQRQPARALTTTMVDIQVVGAHFPWVVLFTEKDTIWGEVQDLADLYGVSAVSGGGEPSMACTENTVRAIVRSEAYQEMRPESIIVLSLTDYDPFGYKIAEAQFRQVLETAGAMGIDELGALREVSHLRLGLEPDQLTPEEREANAYEPKDQGLDEWYQETGGVDDLPLGLELDALPLSRLRRMFADGIEQQIDLEKRRQDLRDAFIDLVACDLLMPGFEEKRKAMVQAARTNGCWDEIANTPIPDDLFQRAAVRGAGWIAPVQIKALFDDCKGELEKIMLDSLPDD